MSVERLTTREYWEEVWRDVSLPIIATPSRDIQRILTHYLPRSDRMTLLEIGCAPGGWMSYFRKDFGYVPTGIEYAENAARLTVENLKAQGIPAKVIHTDFFEYDVTDASFDVVFSAGFIEHFSAPGPVVRKIVSLSASYVVTLVPNLFGINAFISKTLRPYVFRAHHPISLEELRCLHEAAGIRTLFCGSIGGLKFVLPGEKSAFFDRHRRLAWGINLPFRAFNKASEAVSRYLHCYPRTRLLSTTLMYLGMKESR